MIAKTAKADFAALRAQGLEPADEDIVRLNALALEAECGIDTTAANAPRFAVAGGVVFWEPTLAAAEWFEFARSFAADPESEEWLLAFALANARDRARFEALRSPAAIESEVLRFMGRIAGTEGEVARAVAYVLGAGEKLEGDKPLSTEESCAAVEEILAEAAAYSGMQFDYLMTQSVSRLRRLMDAAYRKAGLELTRAAARAQGRYLGELERVRARLAAEKASATAAQGD